MFVHYYHIPKCFMPILRITSMSNPDEVVSKWQKIVLAETMLDKLLASVAGLPAELH